MRILICLLALFTGLASAQSTSVIVDGTSGWVTVDYDFRGSSAYNLTATGKWGGGRVPNVTADGSDEIMHPTVPFPQFPVYSLVGKFDNGRPFLIGRKAILNTYGIKGIENKTLQVIMNDGHRGDNSGAVKLVIKPR